MKLLRHSELEKKVNLSRKVIQEYEASGLFKASYRNKYRHLLYDSKDVKDVLKVKYYRELGYVNSKELLTIINSSKDVQQEIINQKLEELEQQILKIDKTIIVAKSLNALGLDISDIQYNVKLFNELDYNTTFEILSVIFKGEEIFEEEWFDFSSIETMPEKQRMQLLEDMNTVVELVNKGYSLDSREVNTSITALYQMFSKYIMPSLLMFSWSCVYLIGNSDLAKLIDEILGKDSSTIVGQAIRVYSQNNSCDLDRNFMQALKNLYVLSCNHASPTSNQTQKEVNNLYAFINNVKVITKQGKKEGYKRIYYHYMKEYKKTHNDNEASMNYIKFVSSAVTTYYTNL